MMMCTWRPLSHKHFYSSSVRGIRGDLFPVRGDLFRTCVRGDLFRIVEFTVTVDSPSPMMSLRHLSTQPIFSP